MFSDFIVRLACELEAHKQSATEGCAGVTIGTRCKRLLLPNIERYEKSRNSIIVLFWCVTKQVYAVRA